MSSAARPGLEQTPRFLILSKPPPPSPLHPTSSARASPCASANLANFESNGAALVSVAQSFLRCSSFASSRRYHGAKNLGGVAGYGAFDREKAMGWAYNDGYDESTDDLDGGRPAELGRGLVMAKPKKSDRAKGDDVTAIRCSTNSMTW
jgi:hypothetical protein